MQLSFVDRRILHLFISASPRRIRSDRNSGSGPVPFLVEFRPVPIDLAGTSFFSFFMLDYRFSMFCNNASRAPSGSLAVSRAPFQFPDCITCYPLVPRLYHVLPSSSQTVSRAPHPYPLWQHLER